MLKLVHFHHIVRILFKQSKRCHDASFATFHAPYRLVCKIQEKTTVSQNLTITLEVHEGEVEGSYSIEGTAQIPGFSFVVGV